MKRDLTDGAVKEAIGRILRDQPFAGDGETLLEALEAIREHVELRPPEACALQQEWGRRKLAHELIEIGRQEFERVNSAESPSGHEPRRGFGSRIGFVSSDAGARRSAEPVRRSRRRGPAGRLNTRET
jgi:hypothetical protein